MSIGAIVLVVILAVIAGVLGVAAGKSSQLVVKRAAEIKAAPKAVYALLEDFHRWGAWSPWEALDPQMKKTYSGADKGVGAIYAWEGNNKVGAGRMEMTEARSPDKVALTLTMLKPFPAENRVEFFLTPLDGGVTRAAWVMTGRRPFMVKVMSVFMDMDKMIGRDFETGLAKLKAAAEG